jgi:succinate dehydrogenase / fumarate reductase flavoprotein subunit
VNKNQVKLFTRYEMVDLVIIDGRARGIIARNLVTGKLERFAAHAVVIATGGYGNPSSSQPTPWVQTDLPHGNVTRRVHTLQIRMAQNSPDLYPGSRRVPVETDIDVGIAA